MTHLYFDKPSWQIKNLQNVSTMEKILVLIKNINYV